MANTPPLLRPQPRRSFQPTPTSTESSAPPTPSRDSSDYSRLELDADGEQPASRTRSILNLTSSTLYGIYSPSSESARCEPSTPWGTGAQTPSLRSNTDDLKPPIIGAYECPRPSLQISQSSHHQSHIYRDYVQPLTLRTILLFCFGVAYGLVITQLHDTHQVAPIKVEGIEGYSWRYLTSWGIAGILLGSLLPWVDVVWAEAIGKGGDTAVPFKEPEDTRPTTENPEQRSGSGLGADWNPVVRSIGAFIGIAFAIVSFPTANPHIHPTSPHPPGKPANSPHQRKLPWQSTLQVSLTLALVNPVLWYLIDRSKPGLLLSALVGIAGTTVLLGINPDMVPAPAAVAAAASASPLDGFGGMGSTGFVGMGEGGVGYEEWWVGSESIGVWTWVASVLFCSSVCFGNIGRRLAAEGRGKMGKGRRGSS